LQKDIDQYVPLGKIDESIINSHRAPVYTYKPNRVTMHMLIKRAANVNDTFELF